MRLRLNSYIYDIYKDLSNQNHNSQYRYEIFLMMIEYEVFETIYSLSGRLEGHMQKELNV